MCKTVLSLLLSGILTAGISDLAWSLPRCEGKVLRSQISEKQEETLSLLKAKNYAALQARMDGFHSAYVTGRLSDEELSHEFGAFDRWAPSFNPLIQEWIERFPKSYAAHQAMAMHVSAVAWQTRGHALAKDTSEQQMNEFRRGVAEARDWAVRAVNLHPKPILAYQQLMWNARALPVDKALLSSLGLATTSGAKRDALTPRPDVVPLLEESKRIQHDNVVVSQAYILLLAPKWGGTREALAEFAKSSAHPGLSPDRVSTLTYAATMELGDDYEFRKQPDDAVPLYRAASKMCRLNQPFMNIARINIAQKRYAEALDASEGAIAIVPDSSAGRRYKAYALSGLGRHVEAVQLLQELAPEGSADVAYFLGEYYARGEGGLKQDLVQARRLFSIAARGGDERAIKRLAAMKPEK